MKPPQLSPEMIAGQKIMTGFNGTTFSQGLADLISEFNPGGVILFSRNVRTYDQVQTLCREIKNFTLSCGLPPPFIAIDQEGGEVARLKKPFRQFPGNPAVKSREDACRYADSQADELYGLNINMNLAPVVDVVPDGTKSVMKGRAFAGGPDRVAELGCFTIEALQQKNIMAVAKHFPGIGRTTRDSHHELPVVDIGLEVLEKTDLLPFVHALKTGVAGVMLSHVLYPRLDKAWQASLSYRIAKRLLRDRLKFQGISMTDDLNMKAVTHDIATCARQIVKSEIDIALICNSISDTEKMYRAMYNLMKTGSPFRKAGEKSLARILLMKSVYLG